MGGLAEFEKTIALEKASREDRERREKKHRHHHRHHRHHDHRRDASTTQDSQDTNQVRRRDPSSDRDSHSKRDGTVSHDKHRRITSSDDRRSSEESSHRKKRPRKEESRRPGDETRADIPPPIRDSWMTTPSGVGVDYVHRQQKDDQEPSSNEKPRHIISERELNSSALQRINGGKTIDDFRGHPQVEIKYTFGDEGSQWRMTKLKGVYAISEKSGRTVEEVAVERFGSLRDFDDAREERIELERRRLYGKDYALKEKPTGDLYNERTARSNEQPARPIHTTTGRDGDDDYDDSDGEMATKSAYKQRQPVATVDQTTLNRLRAHLMKAKLRKDPNLARLQQEYDEAATALSSRSDNDVSERAVVLDASHSRMLAGTRAEVKSVDTKRGKDRGLVEANDNMSIEDMVREERRTRGVAGGEGLRLAERISKDAKFDDDLEYLDENAEKLAKHTHKSESNLKNIAVHEFTKMNKILESCPLCHHEDRNPPQDLPLAPIVSLATRSFLTLSTDPELTGAEGGAVIVPIDHHTNLLECNEDEWEEIRNFMKSLTRLYHDQGRDVIFYENAAAPHRRMHAALVAVPIPYELGDTAPAFFREAMLSADEEWSQHKKIIDTGKRAREGMGKSAFRKSIAKEMPYFHAWFSLDGGLGHVVEDGTRWPKGDLFAREIIGGMLDVDSSLIKRQGRWTRNDPRLGDFKKRWRKFDWTRILQDTA
ncbi:Pre-mRNA-splicing factor cwf19 [Sporothrix stenoceras]|uniref:Pre-mRNA-splicing factor cwf19 n=1 Tax=Sporothrix stenoceras TaxID=5173 RepID=A0ABR3YM31_9PEZI